MEMMEQLMEIRGQSRTSAHTDNCTLTDDEETVTLFQPSTLVLIIL